MKCEVISTGSKGNAVLLDGRILIDCGVPFSKLKPYADKLEAVLLTHAHSDHFNKAAIKRLAFLRPGLKFYTPEHLLGSVYNLAVSPRQIEPVDECVLYPVNDCAVECFPLIHDVPNVGWEIIVPDEAALYATDTQYIPSSHRNLDLYLIEANYREQELEERRSRKLESGGYSYEDRAAACHMSLETAQKWLAENMGPNSKVIYLHQHDEEVWNHGRT